MESTRPIRALIRGLDALTVLNLRNGATVSEVAQDIRLPRTTTYLFQSPRLLMLRYALQSCRIRVSRQH